jgi:Cdc6-like AAA superfamily ATPase
VSLAEQVFSEEYAVQVVDREREKQILKEYLQDVLRGKKSVLYIYGPPGVGKTTTTKHVVNQFEDAYAAEIIYKNSASTTPNQVLHEIHNRICPEVEGKVPSKTLVLRILNHKLKDSKFTLVLVLDNFDRMQHVDDLLWDVHCISQKLPRMGLILISTRQAKLRHLIGERLYDRLNPDAHEFSPYSARRLFEIISARIKDAYRTDFVEENALWDMCEFVAGRGGNVRYLFSFFVDAVDLLPSKGSGRLSSIEVEETIRRERARELGRTLEDMRSKLPKQYDLFRLIESSRATLDTGTVISLARQGGLHVSPRTIQNYLVELDRVGLVELQRIRKGQGHSQKIKPRVSLKDLR